MGSKNEINKFFAETVKKVNEPPIDINEEFNSIKISSLQALIDTNNTAKSIVTKRPFFFDFLNWLQGGRGQRGQGHNYTLSNDLYVPSNEEIKQYKKFIADQVKPQIRYLESLVSKDGAIVEPDLIKDATKKIIDAENRSVSDLFPKSLATSGSRIYKILESLFRQRGIFSASAFEMEKLFKISSERDKDLFLRFVKQVFLQSTPPVTFWNFEPLFNYSWGASLSQINSLLEDKRNSFINESYRPEKEKQFLVWNFILNNPKTIVIPETYVYKRIHSQQQLAQIQRDIVAANRLKRRDRELSKTAVAVDFDPRKRQRTSRFGSADASAAGAGSATAEATSVSSAARSATESEEPDAFDYNTFSFHFSDPELVVRQRESQGY